MNSHDQRRVIERRAGMPVRIAVALILAGVGFVAIVGSANAADFGHDLHPLRVVATLGVLLLATLMFVRPGCTTGSRVQAASLAVFLGVLAWWRVPCRLDGPHLFEAAARRDALNLMLTLLPPDDIKPLSRIHDSIETLSNYFPTLCADTRERLAVRVEEVIAARVKELKELSATDPAGYVRTAALRREMATAFPETKLKLIATEERWAARWARFTAIGYTESDMSATFVRAACRNAEKQLLELSTIDESPERLMEARRILFQAAHETAEKEIQGHIENRNYDRAFGVALAHQFEWTPSQGLIGQYEKQQLDSLRDRCETLRIPGGDPELVPAPRTVEIAPKPRPK